VSKRIVSKDHRFIYTNAFRIKISDNDIAITVSNQHAFGDEDIGQLTYSDEATLMMTPRSLKVLSIVLQNTIADFEKNFGEIKLPEGKEEQLTQSLSEAQRFPASD
jgi:hypothetical protein